MRHVAVGSLVALVLLAGCGRRVSFVTPHDQSGKVIREWERVSIEDFDPDQHWLEFTAQDGAKSSI